MIIASPEFEMAANAWAENKAQIQALQDENKKIENFILERFSTVDQTSDAKGTERLQTEDEQMTVVIEHKLNVSVDMEKAREMLELMHKPPEHFFNVKYDYSANVEKLLPESDKELLEGVLSVKRAKPSFKIIRKEDK